MATDMLTQAFDGITPLPIDNEILAGVEDEGYNPFPGNPRYLAILNDQGQLYRVICCYGPGSAIGAAQHLAGLGLVDRIDMPPPHYRPTDLLTGRAINTQWDGVFQLGSTAHPIPAFRELDPTPPRPISDLRPEYAVTRLPRTGEILTAADGSKFFVEEVAMIKESVHGLDEGNVLAPDSFFAIIFEGDNPDNVTAKTRYHELDNTDFAYFCSDHGIRL